MEWLNQHAHRYFERGTEEFNIMHNFLIQHPNYNKWKFKDVLAFKITRTPKKKTIQVLAKFEETGWRPVSWKACLTGKTNTITETQKLNSALRYAIRPQISYFRQLNPLKKCSLCETISETKMEVDHDKRYGTFSQLRDYFIELYGKPKSFWWDSKSRSFRMSNKDLEKIWQSHHSEYGVLRYLCENCNKKEK